MLLNNNNNNNNNNSNKKKKNLSTQYFINLNPLTYIKIITQRINQRVGSDTTCYNPISISPYFNSTKINALIYIYWNI